MANQGNSWRKMMLKSRLPTAPTTSRKSIANLIKQSKDQEKKRLESKKE